MKTGIFVIILAFITAFPCYGQSGGRYRVRDRRLSLEKQLESDLESALLKAGPVYILGNLSLIDAGYNSNIQNNTGEEQSDFTLRASPGITLITPFGNSLYLYIKGSYSYLMYFDTSDLNRSNYLIGADILALFNYFSLSAGITIQRDADFFESEIDQRLLREDRTSRISSEVKFSSKLSLELDYSLSELDFPDDADIDTLLSRKTGFFTASVHAKLLPNTSFSLGYGTIDYEFMDNPVYDSKSSSYTLTINWERQSSYYLDLGLSYIDFEPENMPDKGYDGFFPDILLSFPIFYRMNISLSSERSIYFSKNIDNFYYISQRNGIEAEYALSRNFSIIGNYFFGKNSYQFPTTIDEQEIIPEDDIYSYGGGFRILLFDMLNTKIIVSEETKESNIDSNNYDTVRVYLSTSYKF